MKTLMSANEAIARGAHEYGITVAAGYPGTPSTEILENIVKYEGIKAQWSPNEKVAMEVGVGASIGGARTIVTMKHVGLNVAADPLFTFSYTGVNGGLILVAADDPGMHSSQNEQDSRLYAKFSKVAMLEPSNSQEAKDFVGLALAISEEFDTPVMLRTTMRINHSQSLVELKDPIQATVKEYKKDPKKYVMMPAFARIRHVEVEKRLEALKEYNNSNRDGINKIEYNDQSIGIITSGVCYQYVKEAMPDASILKLGMTFPLPDKLIKEFAEMVQQLYIVEELEPYMEEQVKAMGIKVLGKELFPIVGEITPSMIASKLVGPMVKDVIAATAAKKAPLAENIPIRPPVMCPGCPHRGIFYIFKQLKLVVAGDIGCYTLGALPPLDSMDTCICMGASISAGLGLEKANPSLKGKIVSVIGDSTFFHSGITGLIDVVYNRGTTTTVILDNSTTAMTGHQEHPSTGHTLQNEPTHMVDIPKLVEAIGVKRIHVLDPFDLPKVKEVLAEEVAINEPSVIIVKRPCALITKEKNPPISIVEDQCTGCKRCMGIGCPALTQRDGKAQLNSTLCTGCGVCVGLCKFEAMVKAGEDNAK
jgi:indolepyruvate ferredoxin oxidoreductase, alpha subunit